jgi:cytosine/adenosine deaminase-related metal-dependent hydrolase
VLISHGTNPTNDDEARIQSSGAKVSSTPDTELGVGPGEPVCFRPALKGLTSFGIDCHTANASSIALQAHLAMQFERATQHEKFLRQGKTSNHVSTTVEEAFEIATMGGAQAIGMEKEIGSREVGKEADVIVWDASSSAICCAVEENPVAAILMHSSIQDIEMEFVGGQIRKSEGQLGSVQIGGDMKVEGIEQVEVQWKDVRTELLKGRVEFNKAIDGVDMSKVREGVIDGFHIDRSLLVDTV